MKIIIVFFLVVAPSLGFSQTECKVTYISNEGFLLEVDGIKVLVDALFDNINESWCDSPSDSSIELMKKSKFPFDNVDIIAITHKHRDHFNESVVVDHLLSNPTVKVICPKQVGDILNKNPEFHKFSDRIISITPQFLSDTLINVSNIPIRIVRLEHSHYMIKDSLSGTMVNKHRTIENVGYVFNMNGIKIFHCGDTNPLNEEEYATFSLNKEEIDIAFLERAFYAHEKTALIDKHIDPKNIILMHINPNNMPMYLEHFKEAKNIKIFTQKMESITINN